MTVDDIILVRDRYYILATSALADDRTLVLKRGDTFAVFDRYGDVQPVGQGQQGLFHADTRYLSRLELRLGGARPLLLSSTVTEDNAFLTADLTNTDLSDDGAVQLARDTVHVFRTAFLVDGACCLGFGARNFGAGPVALAVSLRFEADFTDIFEVRGSQRARRGAMLSPRVEGAAVHLGYRGLDERVRTTHLRFEPPPADLSATAAGWELRLGPGERTELMVVIQCERDDRPAPVVGFGSARAEVIAATELERQGWCDISTSNQQFDEWTARSAADLRMMVTDTPSGPYPYAGVPWFSTPFGRDGIITALETLWVQPALAAGVLRFLAATQADAVSAVRDSEPGKILHEMRGGEMSALGEVPFERYYGSHDSTPLFVMLAGAYHAHTGDTALIESIWPHLTAAVGWMSRHGDVDGDGFLEYARRDARGLINQGWKDSGDSISHAGGDLAEGPIALAEVQAYAHAAWGAGARLAEVLGQRATADELAERGEALRTRIERTFWSDAIGTYALALDGEKRACVVRTSNAGHVLYTGTASAERAAVVGRMLFADDMFSGWGVRTLSERERRYNPMSYHNGSVWPHDSALVAAGLARYGMKAEALRIFAGLFEASQYVDLHRLPELFCGFARRGGEGPTRYPVACLPQAWAAGAPFLLLQSVLGLTVDGARNRVVLDRPQLPVFLDHVRLRGLAVGSGRVDLALVRHDDDVGVTVTRRQGPVEIVVVK
jgi:glycogen debranching enzyme